MEMSLSTPNRSLADPNTGITMPCWRLAQSATADCLDGAHGMPPTKLSAAAAAAAAGALTTEAVSDLPLDIGLRPQPCGSAETGGGYM